MTEPTPGDALRNLGLEVYRQAARANEAEAARDTILQIVADWVDVVARTAVTDIDDLIWDLEQAGYKLPDPTEEAP